VTWVNVWGPALIVCLTAFMGFLWGNGRVKDLKEDVIRHIDGLEKRLTDKIDAVEKRLDDKIDGVEKRLTDRMERLEHPIYRP
jgi:hypothetical protein